MKPRSKTEFTRTGKAKKIVRVAPQRPSALSGKIPNEKLPPRKLATPGLWADGPASVFNNSRALYTVDPTEVEVEMSKNDRAFKPLREKNKGRVIL